MTVKNCVNEKRRLNLRNEICIIKKGHQGRRNRGGQGGGALAPPKFQKFNGEEVKRGTF